ncbi:aldehyde dehydrogenase family protein [Mesorhizobium sp. A556]
MDLDGLPETSPVFIPRQNTQLRLRPPSVFSEVTQDMSVVREEIFRPILSISRWSKLDKT